MISAQAALFQVDWLSVQVLPDRFALATENEAFYRHLHDLVASMNLRTGGLSLAELHTG